MSRILADQIQKPGGVVLSLPTASGTAGQFIKTDGQGNLSFANPTVNEPGKSWLIAQENTVNIGSLISHTDRTNIYSTGEWGSSAAWTTYTNYQAHADNSAIQFMNMAMGDGRNSSDPTSNYMQGADAENEMPRRVQFANGSRLGFMRDVFHYDNSTGNAGHSLRVLPVRNTSSASVTATFTGYVSNYWSSGNEGCQLFYFTPNSSKYSTCTSVTGTSVATITSTNTRNQVLTGSVTIPAGTTVLVCLTSTDWYETTYRFKDTNYFAKLNDVFTGSNGLICDMRMLTNLVRGNPRLPYAGSLTEMYRLWTSCATAYGDR